MKKYFIIHPFLFGLFPILFLVSHNVEQVSLSEILLPSAFVLCIVFVIILFSSLFAKDIKKVAVILSVSIILFFAYGHIYGLIVDLSIGNFEIGRHRYLLIIWGLILVCSAYLTIRTRKDLQNFTNTLNVIAFSLVLVSLLNIGLYRLKTISVHHDIDKSLEDSEIDFEDIGKEIVLRDIYYIILDGYASASTLKDVYDYDNQNFIDHLHAKDFYVATKSRSNYPITYLSLASSLNIEYINYLTDVLSKESIDLTIPYQMIQDSKVLNFLKMNNYKFIHFSTGWGPTHRNEYADVDFISGTTNEILTVLIKSTLLQPFTMGVLIDESRKTILNILSKLAEVYKIKGPKFVFAHIILPHPPYLFGANGEPVPETDLKLTGNVWRQKDNYLNQLIFLNKEVKKFVDEILANSEIPPIIILQADHGPAPTFPDGFFGWRSRELPSDDMLQERFSIFNAYHLPLGGSELLYESITPVNTFRVVFDFYFGTNYGLLEDKSYYSTYHRPFDFINVTDRLKYDSGLNYK